MSELEYFVEKNSTRRKTSALQIAPSKFIEILHLLNAFFSLSPQWMRRSFSDCIILELSELQINNTQISIKCIQSEIILVKKYRIMTRYIQDRGELETESLPVFRESVITSTTFINSAHVEIIFLKMTSDLLLPLKLKNGIMELLRF
jgi:hypothetical protein